VLATGTETTEPGLVERILQAIREFFEALMEAIRSVVVTVHGRLASIDVTGPSQALSGGGVRGPGAAVAIAIACGGGTYCAVEGLPDPLSKLGRDVLGQREAPPPKKATPGATGRAKAAAPTEGRALIVAAPREAPRRTRRESQPADRRSDSERVADEFGLEASTASAPRAAPPAPVSRTAQAQACEFGVDGC
jgi:hypothetical protein